jgi:hypothetical protein
VRESFLLKASRKDNIFVRIGCARISASIFSDVLRVAGERKHQPLSSTPSGNKKDIIKLMIKK